MRARKTAIVNEGPKVEIRLSHDQALVLPDWLDRVMSQEKFKAVVDDRAVWSSLFRIAGTLDKALPEIFGSDYGEQMARAQERLVAGLGEFEL